MEELAAVSGPSRNTRSRTRVFGYTGAIGAGKAHVLAPFLRDQSRITLRGAVAKTGCVTKSQKYELIDHLLNLASVGEVLSLFNIMHLKVFVIKYVHPETLVRFLYRTESELWVFRICDCIWEGELSEM